MRGTGCRGTRATERLEGALRSLLCRASARTAGRLLFEHLPPAEIRGWRGPEDLEGYEETHEAKKETLVGSVYRRTDLYCTTCKPGRGKRLAKTRDRDACKAARHAVVERQSPVWWLNYRRAGKAHSESSGSKRKKDAVAILEERVGDIRKGKPVSAQNARYSFEDAARDLLADYTTNAKSSVDVVTRRVRKHLEPFFAGWRMANITTSDVQRYIVRRQSVASVLVRAARSRRLPDGSVETIPETLRPAGDAEINRELALLKRMFSLAMRAGLLLHRPHIPMLQEPPPRSGFFEPEQLESVVANLPAEVRPVIQFAAMTGWRIDSEVLPLEWRQVDFDAGEVRLEPGTTKNREGRTFPMTRDLRALLLARRAEHERLQKAGVLVPQVFFREVAEGRGGGKKPHPIVSFAKAWKSACRAAGCPGRIPHDLRRTAARNFVRTGIPERVAMHLTGHKTRSVFDRYDIVSGGDLKEAARRLDRVARVGSAAAVQSATDGQ